MFERSTDGAAHMQEQSLLATAGGTSEAVSVTGTSAQSAAIDGNNAYVYASVAVFFRQGADPTALATGVDQIIPAGVPMRINGIVPGNKLAFIAVGNSGTVYITPEA
jgi:hypothetical protein